MDEWKELIQDFLDEAYALLENLEESLLNLEKDLTNPENIAVVFRVAHTIKGGAGAVGFDDVTKLTHIMEDVLDLVRNGKIIFTADDISLLLEVCDELKALLVAHEKKQTHSFDKGLQLIASLENLKKKAISHSTEDSSPEIDEPFFDIDNLPISARFALTPDLLDSLYVALTYNEKLYFIEIRFNEEYELKEVGPFELLNIINKFAEPIIMNPNIEMIDQEYLPYLNLVIPSDETADYIQNKLNLPDVVSKVVVHPLNEEFFTQLNSDFQRDTLSTVPIKENLLQSIDNPQEPNIKTKDQNIIKNKEEEKKRNPTLKVESSRIDELLNLLGELVIIRSGFSQFETDLEKAIQNIRYSLRNFLSSSGLLPLHEDNDQNEIRNTVLRESFSQISNGLDNYIEYVQQLARISGTLQGRMMTLRMVPVQTVFSRFTRLTRDIAKQLNKKIELVMEGGETEIDKGMIDDLYDPLMHMIRNSLDHGIELPEERVQKGKTEVGTIYLKAFQEGDSIFIEISDDGKGIDPEKLKEKALNKGFISQDQADSMTKQEALSLIFMAGFSTAEQISNLSGRGVGMDVVRRKIEELGGTVNIYSELGKGSTIKIQLPLTLAIIQGLLILVGGIHYVIPVVSVEETVILDTTSTLHKLNHYYALEFRDKLIPLIALPTILYGIQIFDSEHYKNICSTQSHQNSTNFSYNHLNNIEVPKDNITNNQELKQEDSLQDVINTYEQKKETRDYCIIVRYGNRQVGIIVPDILGEQDIVIKPLDNKLIHSPGLAAATIVGNGEIGFILDIPQIIRYYLKQQH